MLVRKKTVWYMSINRVITLPYRCSLSDTTLDTMVLHSSLLVSISAHLFMFIPAYRETFPSHPHLFLPWPRLPFTMTEWLYRVILQVQSLIIKCLSFRWVSFVQGYRLCVENLCTWIIFSYKEQSWLDINWSEWVWQLLRVLNKILY